MTTPGRRIPLVTATAAPNSSVTNSVTPVATPVSTAPPPVATPVAAATAAPKDLIEAASEGDVSRVTALLSLRSTNVNRVDKVSCRSIEGKSLVFVLM